MRFFYAYWGNVSLLKLPISNEVHEGLYYSILLYFLAKSPVNRCRCLILDLWKESIAEDYKFILLYMYKWNNFDLHILSFLADNMGQFEARKLIITRNI